MLSRTFGSSQIGLSSVLQYLSALNQIQVLFNGDPVPGYPFVSLAMLAYCKWEGASFPETVVCFGVSAELVNFLWALGMNTTYVLTLRDFAAISF